MSDLYIQRLRSIRDDLDIVRETFSFIRSNWHRNEVAEYFRLRTQPRIQQAADNLETTYFVRLTAEFEGILKDHLASNHPKIKWPAKQKDWTIDWFLSRVLQREKVTLDPDLRQKIDEVRTYRNALAHGNAPSFRVSFSQALARYNTILAQLPDPMP